MSSLTLSLTPASSTSNAAPAAASDNGAAGPGAFHAMLSEQMAGGKAAVKGAPKETATSQTAKPEAKEEDKTEDGTAAQPGEIKAPVVAVPNTPITAVPPTSSVEAEIAIDVLAVKPQALSTLPNLGKGVEAVDPGIVSGAMPKGQFDLRTGGAHQSHAQELIEAKGQPSEGASTEFGAELSAMRTIANYASRSETAPIQPALSPLGMLAPNGAPAQTAMPVLTLQTPVGNPGWAGELASKITYLVGANMQSAELHLNPAHLGPIEVRIHIGADQQTSIAFAVAQTDTLNALESALPRLRQMFNESGVNVVSCSVSGEAFAHNPQQGSAERRGSGSGNSADSNLNTTPPVERTLRLNGLVDVFA